MSKFMRSFCGAFFGAALAIWPAATWDMAILLLVGGVSGWILGYHGDRVISSLIRGYRYARRIGFKLFLKRMVVANAIARAVAGAWHGIGRFARYVAPVFRFLFLTPIPFARWSQGILSLVMITFGAIRATSEAFFQWYKDKEHPINKASTIRFFVGCMNAVLFACFFWWLTDSGLQPGDVLKDTSGKLRILTESGIFWDQFSAAGMLTALLTLATTVIYTRELDSKAGYDGVLNRYERDGALLFFIEESVRFVYFASWIVASIVGGLVSAMLGVVGWAFLAIPAYFGVIFAFRLAWRAVRLNRDYGVISLAVALATGAITFFTLREELVADATFRLTASLLAGAVAGIVSMAITWLCGVMFTKSILTRRLALKWSYVEKGMDNIDPFDTWLPYVWKHWKLLLPVQVQAGFANGL